MPTAISSACSTCAIASRDLSLGRFGRARLAGAALRVAGPRALRRPPIPQCEAEPAGRLHSLRRDRASVRHHYDVSNRFYELLLGPSLVYSCAYFAHPGDSLESAQERKLELICRKLRLAAGGAAARHRLRLGVARPPRGGAPRRASARRDAVRAAGRACAATHRGGRADRSRRGARPRLPPGRRGALRQDRERRDVRARRALAVRHLRGGRARGCCGRAGCSSTTASRASTRAADAGRRSSAATCSRTASCIP